MENVTDKARERDGHRMRKIRGREERRKKRVSQVDKRERDKS